MKSITTGLMITGVLATTAVYADCSDTLIGADNRAGRYQWTGRCYEGPIKGCEPCGPEHTLTIPERTTGWGTCSRTFIASYRADGCSVPFGRYKERFKAACDEHDVCYATPGKDKPFCDDAFERNMLSMCRRDKVKKINIHTVNVN